MTVHREQSMKREDQQDATIRCLLLTSVYSHLRPFTSTNAILCSFVQNRQSCFECLFSCLQK